MRTNNPQKKRTGKPALEKKRIGKPASEKKYTGNTDKNSPKGRSRNNFRKKEENDFDLLDDTQKKGRFAKPKIADPKIAGSKKDFKPFEKNDKFQKKTSRPAYGSNNNAEKSPGKGFAKPVKKDDNYNPQAKYSLKKQIEHNKRNLRASDSIRLNRFLANAGICSRREADEYIRAGVVTVNGEVVTELGTKVTAKDKVMFHDQLVRSEKKVYILLNKPKDCVTTSDDPQARLTVMDLIKDACPERVYPVGRLDRNTMGVLLLTNDGDMAARLTHPKYNKKKIYHVFLDKALTRADMESIAKGIELEDGEIHADKISYVEEGDKKQVGIEIHSGRNRIVRRIFEHFGYKVEKLDRVYFAGLTKQNLPRGRFRFLTEKEVAMLNMGAFE